MLAKLANLGRGRSRPRFEKISKYNGSLARHCWEDKVSSERQDSVDELQQFSPGKGGPNTLEEPKLCYWWQKQE
jgi:hypothetical protein